VKNNKSFSNIYDIAHVKATKNSNFLFKNIVYFLNCCREQKSQEQKYRKFLLLNSYYKTLTCHVEIEMLKLKFGSLQSVFKLHAYKSELLHS
jgi:hypothetical protein